VSKLLGPLNASAYLILAGMAIVFSFGCHNTTTPVPPAPVPVAAAGSSAAKPTLNYFDAEPTILSLGQSASLRWSIDNATEVQVNPEIGAVKPNDHRVISPQQTTTYTLKASNAAGSTEASVTVSVSKPPPPVAEAEDGDAGLSIVTGELRDLHFDYDEGDVTASDRSVLETDAGLLANLFRQNPSVKIIVEGHCDERGSDEYNFALGDRRAVSVRDALVRLGVPAENLEIISFGEQRPLCTSPTEECYARNRRVHFAAAQPARARRASVPQ